MEITEMFIIAEIQLVILIGLLIGLNWRCTSLENKINVLELLLLVASNEHEKETINEIVEKLELENKLNYLSDRQKTDLINGFLHELNKGDDQSV